MNSNRQKTVLCSIMSNDTQVPKLNKKSLIVIIFCSMVSVLTRKFVLFFQHCRMLITYYMGGREAWRLYYLKRRNKRCSLQSGQGERWLREILETADLYQTNPVVTVVFGVAIAFSVYKVKSKFIH